MPLRIDEGLPLSVSPAPAGAGASRVSFGAPRKAGHRKSLPVPRLLQKDPHWCWAACAEMVLVYYGREVAGQCELAGWLHGVEDCCSAAPGEDCRLGCEAEDITRVYSRWGVRSDFREGGVSYFELAGELDAGRPVQVVFHWAEGGGHAVVVSGCEDGPRGKFLQVNDPWADDPSAEHDGLSQVHYDELLTAYGMGTWGYTWTGLEG